MLQDIYDELSREGQRDFWAVFEKEFRRAYSLGQAGDESAAVARRDQVGGGTCRSVVAQVAAQRLDFRAQARDLRRSALAMSRSSSRRAASSAAPMKYDTMLAVNSVISVTPATTTKTATSRVGPTVGTMSP